MTSAEGRAEGEGRSAPRIAREAERGPLLGAIAPLIERVREDERRNAEDERACHQFKNAHRHLLAASQYGAGDPPFKTGSWNISWNKLAA